MLILSFSFGFHSYTEAKKNDRDRLEPSVATNDPAKFPPMDEPKIPYAPMPIYPSISAIRYP